MPHILELKSKAGFESAWVAIRRLKEFTQRDVLCEIGKEFGDNVNADTIKSYIQRLVRGGYVETRGVIRTPRGTRLMQYALVKDVGVCAPRLQKNGAPSVTGLKHEALWRSMKMLGTFSLRELRLASSTDKVAPCAEETADYCEHLTRAGYLQRTSAGNYRFLPSQFTGPRAPVITRVDTVYDANTRQIVYAGPLEVTV